MKNGNNKLANSDLSSHLDLNIIKQEEYLPMKCPYNYQFYFDNIQIVGKDNFKDDYLKIFKRNRKELTSLTQSPQTSTFFTSPIENKTFDFDVKKKNNNNNEINCEDNNGIDILNNDDKNKIYEIDNINQKSEIDYELSYKKQIEKELKEEKMQSSCCLIF